MAYAATIGFFDGVHLGHQYLLRQVRQAAALHHAMSLAVTFRLHPQTVLRGTSPKLLTSLSEREKALQQQVDTVLVIDFETIHTLTAQAFMQFLHDEHDVRLLLMGYDHRFGSDGTHRIEDYIHWGEKAGVEVQIVEPMPGETVSSSVIRRALHAGDISTANRLLGRPYTLNGIVVHGRGIGKTIGFPTANICPTDPNRLIPRDGVYAVHARFAEQLRPALLNIGTNPTVQGTARTIEVHIPDFEGDLYQKTLSVQFLLRLRDEQHFASLALLQARIAQDIAYLRAL